MRQPGFGEPPHAPQTDGLQQQQQMMGQSQYPPQFGQQQGQYGQAPGQPPMQAPQYAQPAQTQQAQYLPQQPDAYHPSPSQQPYPSTSLQPPVNPAAASGAAQPHPPDMYATSGAAPGGQQGYLVPSGPMPPNVLLQTDQQHAHFSYQPTAPQSQTQVPGVQTSLQQPSTAALQVLVLGGNNCIVNRKQQALISFIE